MLIKERLRKIKRKYCRKKDIIKEYKNDCIEYLKYNYNSDIKTKNSLEAKILRQTHVIEKGMSITSPRPGFGVEKARELLQYINEFVNCGYPIENSTPIKNALGVIDAYIKFHEKRGFRPENVIEDYNELKSILPSLEEKYGIVHVNKSELYEEIHSKFPAFFASRHSVRQFANIPIRAEDIMKSVELALRAPSACNRQSCKAYYYQGKSINQRLGELIDGNTGFDSEVQNYIVVTSDISAFYDAFERNQMYVDGGIFTMALVEALHYYGIASCILQNGELKEKNKKFKEICNNIPENEKIILFIAIGYYKEEFTYATSHRRKLDEILKIN